MNYRYILTLAFICCFFSCSKESDPSDNSGGDENPVSIQSQLSYSHSNNATNYIVYDNEEFIFDNDKLSVVTENGAISSFNKVSYTLGVHLLEASLENINAVITRDDGLYIGTSDGHLLVYEDGNFRGFPILIHKMKRFWQNNPVQALWEWTDQATSILGYEFVSGVLRSEIEYEEENGFVIKDEYPCINALNITENHCEDYELIDFASLDRLAMLGRYGQLLILPDYGNSSIYMYEPNFSNLSINSFSQIEIFYSASSISQAPDKFYFDHLWVNTDNGLAFYRIQEDEELNIIDEQWNYVTTANSGLSSNNIIDMKFLSDERLIAFSNNPSRLNYINAEDGMVCSLAPPSTQAITKMEIQQNEVFITQGKEIHRISVSDIETACGF